MSDITDAPALQERLWPLCETVARRLQAKKLGGWTVTLKLKDTQFRLFTRSRRMRVPTQRAENLYQTALPLIEKEATGRAFRLIGIGVADLTDQSEADPPDLFQPLTQASDRTEKAIEAIRDRHGNAAIRRGRGS
jgi:DNA polymerase-4